MFENSGWRLYSYLASVLLVIFLALGVAPWLAILTGTALGWLLYGALYHYTELKALRAKVQSREYKVAVFREVLDAAEVQIELVAAPQHSDGLPDPEEWS